MKKIHLVIIGLVVGMVLAVFLRNVFTQHSGLDTQDSEVVRVGYMPNITHLHALTGRNRGDFEKAFEPDVKVQWKMFSAGPPMMTALMAGELDLAYVGPGPAINTYIRSKGDALNIIAGASSGGSGLVVRENETITQARDFHGKRIATPQIANTQDISARYWLKENGMKLSEYGGDVMVLPLAGADQLFMMQKGEVDGVWAAEPWLSRLVHEAGGKLLIDEREIWPGKKYLTTVLVAKKDYIKNHPERVKQWVAVHKVLTNWIRKNKKEAGNSANDEFERITHKRLNDRVLNEALNRLEAVNDPMPSALKEQVRRAFEVGYLGKTLPDIEGIVDDSFIASSGTKGKK